MELTTGIGKCVHQASYARTAKLHENKRGSCRDLR